MLIVYIIIPSVIALIMPIVSVIMNNNARKREKALNKAEFVMKASKAFCITMVIFTVIWVIVMFAMKFPLS